MKISLFAVCAFFVAGFLFSVEIPPADTQIKNSGSIPTSEPGKAADILPGTAVQSAPDIPKKTEQIGVPDTTAVPASVSDVPTAEEPSVGKDLLRLFERIRLESPVLYNRLNAKDRTRIFETVLKSLDTGIRPETGTQVSEEPSAENKYRGKTIEDNHIYYIRMDSISKESLAQFKEDCIAGARLRNPPHSMLLDLRSARGGDYKLLPEILAYFHPGKQGSPQPETEYFRNLPLAVLTGKRTSGPAELLSALLEHENHAVTLGMAGEGKIFPVKRITLNGTEWSIPVIPEEYAEIAPLARKPMIACPAEPQIDYKKLADANEIARDSALRRAVDLLLSLHALSRSVMK